MGPRSLFVEMQHFFLFKAWHCYLDFNDLALNLRFSDKNKILMNFEGILFPDATDVH